jgi:hypothetical protein
MLNKISVTDRYVLPTPEDIFDNIKDAGVYTTLDLRWEFHQVRVVEEDVPKTAFWGPDGLYEWVMMPFGLKNAPVFFHKIMDKTLRDVRAFARCYIDDIIIFSRSHAEQNVHLREVFQRLREKGIQCRPKKLRCAVKDVLYLGHLVVPNGIAPQDVKVEAITKMVAPTDVSELRALLGTYNYYRKFIKNFARKAAPLNRLLQNDVPWEWSEPCQEAFQSLKVSMTEAPILRRPNMNLPFELHIDWSAVGLCAVLVEIDSNGKEFVIAYASRSNNRTERNYSSCYGECLAAVWVVSYFQIYLYGRPFVLKTDLESLKWLMTSEKLTVMHARWASILQEYNVDIQHRAGVTHGDADRLSRNPLPSEEDRNDARMHHNSPVTSVTAGLALLACLGAEAIKAAANQPEFGGTEKDGDPQATESSAANPTSRDVWQDLATIAYLRTGSHAPEQTVPAKDRIQHRAKHYYFENDLLRKRMPAGIDKIVPEPHLRTNLIRATHLDTGHYGIKKTYFLLEPVYVLTGMYEQVRFEVRACAACDRVKASFEVRDTVLKPLPIMGLFYRWGVNLCKMPHTFEDGNKYVVIMIEHFTKWVELVPSLRSRLSILQRR